MAWRDGASILIMALLSLRTVGAGASHSPALRFEHANLVTMTSAAVQRDAVVIVAGQRILYAGSPQAAPTAPDARVVDLTGRYVLPGLNDMHVHLEYTESLPDSAVRDELLLYVANGVTTIRNMGGSAWHLIIRQRLASGNILGPRMFTAGPIVESHRSHAALQPPTFKELHGPDEARMEIRAQKAAGFDFVKVYNQIDTPTYEAIVETAREQGLPIIGHVPIEPGLEAAFRNHQASIEHFRGYDLELSADRHSTRPEIRFAGWRNASDERLRELTRRTVAAGAWNVPTIVSLEILNDSPQNRAIGAEYPFLPAHLYEEMNSYYLHAIFSAEVLKMMLDGLPRQYAFIKMLNDAGAPIMSGTDAAAPGVGLHREIAIMHAAGLSNYDALRTATSTPGAWLSRFARIAEPSGTVRTGARADLLILASDPLLDLSALDSIEGVVVAGHYLTGSEIRALLADLRARNAQAIREIKARLAAPAQSAAP